ncbi:unnamed protein product [Withania somnifera]
MYHPTTMATIKGRFDPLVLMNTINKLGNKAELISYNKHSHVHAEVHAAPDQQNEAAPHPCKDKGKTKVGLEKKNQHCSRHEDSYDDDSAEAAEFVSRKSDEYHKPEAYVPPKGVDEAICRDRFCKIQKRHGSIHERVTKEAREKASSIEASYPHYHPRMFLPEYGFHTPTLPMSGMNDPTSYLNNQNPRKCNTM